jgi:hypothetical protein
MHRLRRECMKRTDVKNKRLACTLDRPLFDSQKRMKSLAGTHLRFAHHRGILPFLLW